MNADITLTLNTKSIDSGSKSAIASFQNIQNEATKTGSTIDNIKSKISQLDGKAIAKFGAGMVGLATNVYTAQEAFKGLNDWNIKLRQSSLRVSQAEEQVNKLRAEGKTNTLDYQQALEKLEIAQLKHEKTQGDANKAQMLFMFNMATMATTTIPMSIKGMIDFTKSLKSVQNGFKLLDVATSKYVLIALAVIGAFEGIAHAIKYFSGGEIDITIEKLSGDLFGAINKNIGGANELTTELTESSYAMNEFGTASEYAGSGVYALGGATSETAKAISGLSSSFGKTSESIMAFQEQLAGVGLKDLENRALAINTLFESTISQNIDRSSAEWKMAISSIIPEIENIALELEKAGKGGGKSFVNEIKSMVGDTTGELQEIVDKIDEIDSKLSNIGEKKNDLLAISDATSFEGIVSGLKNSEAVIRFNALSRQIQIEASNGNAIGVNYLAGQLRSQIAKFNSEQNFTSGLKSTTFTNMAKTWSNAVNNIIRANRALGTVENVKSMFSQFSGLGITQSTVNYMANLNRVVNTSTRKSLSGFGGTTKFAGRTLTKSKGKKKRGKGINWDERVRGQGYLLTGGVMNESILNALTGINVSTESFIQRIGGRGWSLAPTLKREQLISALNNANLIRSNNRKMVTDEIMRLESLYGMDLYDENNIPILLENMYLEGLFDNAGNLPRDFQSKYASFLSSEITNIQKEFEYKRQQNFFSGYSDIFTRIFGSDIEYDLAVRDEKTVRMFSDILKFANKSRYQTIGT